jgi:hypothetical protein
MAFALDIQNLPAAAQRLLQPDAPIGARTMAARGVIPGLRPGDIATVVAALTHDLDPSVAEAAAKTFATLPPPILDGALQSDLPGAVIELFAHRYAERHDVIERLLRMPRVGREALELLAERADERAGELIATNERLMLAHPTVIEKLYMNKRVRMSTADRLLELAVRNGLELDIPAYKEAALAIRDELIAEASQEPTFDDLLFKEADALAQRIALADDEDTHAIDDEGKEQVKDKFVPLHAKLAAMTISQRIRTATLGNAAERAILVRDPNRLVAASAAKSPLMTENDAARISASRSVSDDVLRIIAQNREFTRHYQVKLNLVMNPRTPFSFAARLVPHLRDNDLRSLSKSKNVPGAVSQAVKQQLLRKQGKAQRGG